MLQHKVVYNVLPARATHSRKPPIKLMQCRKTNVTSPADHCKLHTNSRFWCYQKPNEAITLPTSHIPYGWHDRSKRWQVLN